MKNENITGGFKKLKQDLAGMSFKEKAEHIWTYYRSWVIVAIAVVMLISIFATSFINLTTKTVSAGVCINVPLADGAEAYLRSGLEEQLVTGKGRERVYFKLDYTDSADVQNNLNIVESMQSLVASKDLDYIILDDAALALLGTQDIFMNLEEFFTPEELQGLEICTITRAGQAEELPILIDITQWPVVKQNDQSTNHYYFTVIGNTPRPDAVRTALKLLQLYGAEG